MPRRVPPPDKPPRARTEIERLGLTQQQVAEKAGISIAQYRRLERHQLNNPPLDYFVNVSIVLDDAGRDARRLVG